METITTTPNRLRIEREAQGLTRRDLAHFAKCSVSTIQALEMQRMSGSVRLKVRIARTLRVPVAELFPLE